jgi:hypothetical protein
LDTRRMRFEHEAAPVRVHERMALTSVDLLSSIIAAWPAGLGGLGALAVDDCRRGAGVAPDPFAICHHERVVYPQSARRRAGRRTSGKSSPKVASRLAAAATGSPPA